MKARTLRELTRGELVQRMNELEEERFNLRMRRSLKDLDNPLRLRILDREIARILTVLHEDEKGIRPLAKDKTTVLGEKK
ncbi:MAG: 50S ribosomal protein L29 [Candidatus Zixiibacteriota bacterium]|nr:MAG: 50S ribosomal protein L29 [candidate division Zixibacteria bacterium]